MDFIIEEHGGLESFWKLARAYQKKHSLEKAIDASFGMPYEQFDQDWRTWLQQNYGA